jgi:flagellar protein FlaJ
MSTRGADELGLSEDYGLDSLGRPVTESDPDNRRELREHYGFVRGTFKGHPERYADLQRALNQARRSETYDEYLSDSVRYAVGGSLLGVVLGLLVALLLASVGILDGLASPIADPGGLGTWIGQNRLLVAAAGLSVGGMVLVGGLIWAVRLRYPGIVAAQRRRSIDVTLPHAIVFMYALSHGGMNLYGVVKDLADAEDAYGEVSREFGTVVRDVELFGNDLYTALRNTRNITPSENMEQFLDDMLSVLDSGGDTTVFFEDEAENYLDEAENQQERFLETLSVLSEVFVVGFVAAPLFIIVILLVMSLLGAGTLTQLGLIVYLVLPLGMLGYLVLIDYLSTPYKPEKVAKSSTRNADDAGGYAPVLVARDVVTDIRQVLGALRARVTDRIHGNVTTPRTPAERLEQDHYRYRRRRHRRAFRAFLRRPIAAIRNRPDVSVVVTAPLAILALLGVVAAGIATPSLEAMIGAPVRTTIWLVVVPTMIVAVPLSYFYERRRRRQASIAKRFPDTLNILASANRMGIQFIDALGLIARWTSGPIAHELRLVRNDIRWNHDTGTALRSFATRLGSAQLSRTVRLIGGGLRSSGDLSEILTVAARDTKSRYRMERKRRTELSSYTAVVIIGFLVYLLVLILLAEHYLEPVAGLTAPPDIDGMNAPFDFASLDVQVYTALFFHSTIIQAFGSGLLAGKLVDNSVRSGLKYSIALTLVAVVAFLLI